MKASIKKITLIEDVPSIRENVSKFINLHDEFEVCKTFDSVESFILSVDHNSAFCPDIILLDIGLPGMSGVDGIPHILGKRPDIDIICSPPMRKKKSSSRRYAQEHAPTSLRKHH